jgi:hypothetical protein
MKPRDSVTALLHHDDVHGRESPWPFLYSVVPGVGIVKNVDAASVAAPEAKRNAPEAPRKAPEIAKKAPTKLTSRVVKGRPPETKKGAKNTSFAKTIDVEAALKEVDEAWRGRK